MTEFNETEVTAPAARLLPAAEGEIHDQVAALLSWEHMATRAYSANTRRAWRADWATYSAFCFKIKATALPADPMTVRLHSRSSAGGQKTRLDLTISRHHHPRPSSGPRDESL
jgi:hypothetical protein